MDLLWNVGLAQNLLCLEKYPLWPRAIGKRSAEKSWIMGPLPRPPMYRIDAHVDLTLMVSDLLIPNSNVWDVSQVRSLFVAEDANSILNMRVERHQSDVLLWGFTSHGTYSSQSGYELTETITNLNPPHHSGLPPVEKMLWRSIWKLQTTPKIRHFV